MKKKPPVKETLGLLLSVMLAVNLAAWPVEEDHQSHHHLNEIGISTGIVRMQPETETAAGLHLHAMRRFGDEGLKKFFGVGLGFEVIFSEHRHYVIMGALGVFPWKNLVLTFSPGLLTAKEDGENHRLFSFHSEAVYEFEVGGFGIGPALAFSAAGGNTHFTVGIHIGKGF
jgi:hypothetical protein